MFLMCAARMFSLNSGVNILFFSEIWCERKYWHIKRWLRYHLYLRLVLAAAASFMHVWARINKNENRKKTSFAYVYESRIVQNFLVCICTSIKNIFSFSLGLVVFYLCLFLIQQSKFKCLNTFEMENALSAVKRKEKLSEIMLLSVVFPVGADARWLSSQWLYFVIYKKRAHI